VVSADRLIFAPTELATTILRHEGLCAGSCSLPWLSDARFLATDVLDRQVYSYPLLCLVDNFIRVSSNNQAGAASV
jgi:hypothetical protein